MERLDQSRMNNTEMDISKFGDWTTQLDGINESFIQASPFPHVVIDNFFSADFADKIIESFPTMNWEGWMQYYNPIEIKKVFDKVDEMPTTLQEVFYQLNSPALINMIKTITNIPNLEADPYLHGGGLHCIPRGGKLNLHLDYSIHPLSGKERRVNLIIYLNKEFQPEWNGNLELWPSDLKQCGAQVTPLFNRAAIFQTYDESWHGHPHRLSCPPDQARKSLAVYYVSEPREGANRRYKAHFIQTPNEPGDERIQKLLDIRDTRRITSEDITEIFPDWESVCFSECSRD